MAARGAHATVKLYLDMKLTEEQTERVERALQGEVEVKELQTSEELHAFADDWNWDSGVEPLLEIIRNPLCDKGTASLIYWRADVISFYEAASREEVNEYEIEVYDLIKEVEAKFVSGFYTQQNIRFDPKDDGADWVRKHPGELAQEIPEELMKPTPGEPLKRDAW